MYLKPDPTLAARAMAEAKRRGLVVPTRPVKKAAPVANLREWLGRVSPQFNWRWPHIRAIGDALDDVTAGKCKRLMLFLPPRHGKSEFATIRYPVYRLECNPALRVIIGAYNQTLAAKFSRRSRNIARERMTISDDRSAADDWETPQSGGVRAAGVGSGVTGHGADLIIIDDPVKSREEAESRAYRDRCWDWYTNDLYTRLEPGGAIILIMTRWHTDDLAGRILASESGQSWRVISLPAIAERDDPLGRGEGEALCPDRFPVDELLGIKRVMGLAFTALYQQRPHPKEGGLFKVGKVELVADCPATMRRVRYWDRAATADGGDYTVGLLMGASDDGVFYVEDVVRGQWDSETRQQVMRQTAESDTLRYRNVLTAAEEEPGSAGKDVSAAFYKLLAGYSVDVERVTGSKETRAIPLSDQWNVGNVKVKRAAWTADYLAEMAEFPTGAHDDQVDTSSGAFNKLSRAGSGWQDVTGLGNVEGYKSKWQ